MPLTFNAIYLGNPGIFLDPTEGNDVAENAALFVGQTFGGPGEGLSSQWVSFTSVNNGGNSTALDMNNSVVNDQAIIDNGSGPVAYVFDGTAVFSGVITYVDGTTSATDLQFVLVQMTNGDLYLVPRPTEGDPTNDALSANRIQSVTFTDVSGDTYSGMAIDRPVISFINCFTPGARIAVPEGTTLVEDLRVGDLVVTRDHGAQAIRWIGKRTLSAADLARNPGLRPIRIAAGALGRGLPEQDLIVSPQHRFMMVSRIAARMFGMAEVLVAAKHLVGCPGIEIIEDCTGIDYLHFTCDQHELVYADGSVTETLYLGAQALASLAEGARQELQALFPEILPTVGTAAPPVPARMLLTGRQGRSLSRRHLRNRVPLVA